MSPNSRIGNTMLLRLGSSHKLYSVYFDFLYRHSKLFLLLPFFLCIFLGYGIIDLKENNDGRIFFDEDSPERQQLVDLEHRFTESNSLLLVLSSPKNDIFNAEQLKVILDITDMSWQLPYVTRVNSLSNYQRITSEEDELIIEDLFSEDILTNPLAIEEIKKYSISERDLVGQLLSADGRTTAIALNIAAPRGDSQAIKELMLEVSKIRLNIHESDSGLDLYVTGDIPLDNAFSEAYAYDLQNLFPFFLLVVFLLCFFFFRSLILSSVILFMMILVVAATMGSAGYLGIDLTAGTTGVPIILITISLADFIHLLSAMRREVRSGLTATMAFQNAVKSNFLPISLTSFTTLVGFISLNFSEAPPFRDLGNLVAIGILISYLLTFTFFPIILTKINFTNIFKQQSFEVLLSSNFLLWVSEIIVEKRKFIFAVILLLSLIISTGLAKIEFDDDWVKYFGEDNQFRIDTEFVVSNLTGVDTIEYIVSSGKEGGVSDGTFLKKLNEFEEWAYTQPEIIHVSSVVSLFKKMNFHMNGGGKNGSGNISDDNNLNAQYLLMYEMSLPVGLDLNDRIDIEKEATRVTITAKNMTSQQMRALDVHVSQKLREMGLIGANEGGSGIPLMFANLSEKNIKSMLWGIIFALGVVSLVITVFFNSLRLGVISFIVNILPILLGFGIWGWLYQYVGISLTVIAAIAFGIVVDDSIHFITKYNKALYANNNVIESLQATYIEVGGALLITSIILVSGFSILTFSLFQPTWGLGLISVIMILIALIYDFLLLPILLCFNQQDIKN